MQISVTCTYCEEKIIVRLEENQPAPTSDENETNISRVAKRIADLAWESVKDVY